MLWPAPAPPYAETVFYLGYAIDVSYRRLLVTAPNGDTAEFKSMVSARTWVRSHRRSQR